MPTSAEYRALHREEIAAYHRDYYRAHSTRPPRVAGSERAEKLCRKCETVKPRDHFTARMSGRVGHLATYCKSCSSAAFGARRVAAIVADPVAQHRREKDAKLRKAYGISLSDYEAMLTAQGGRCAVCGTDDPSSCRKAYKRIARPAFDVDHCHATGRVRGLLCSRCNRLVGLAGDDPERALCLARYLNKE